MAKKLSTDKKRISMVMNHIKGNITRKMKLPMPLDTKYVGEKQALTAEQKYERWKYCEKKK